MKIGIMTFWSSDMNYGQILQAYALQAYLKRQGHEAFLIKYLSVNDKQKKSFTEQLRDFSINKIITFISKEIKKNNIKKDKLKHPRYFDEFRKNFLSMGDTTYKSLSDLKKNPPAADVYICGSDQIWNSDFSFCEAYLLPFGNSSTLRVSYAASFGHAQLKESDVPLFKKYIGSFNAVGVREKTGVRICENLGVKYAKWTPDPTFLLNRKEWLQLTKTLDLNKGRKNIFIYTLGNRPLKDKSQILDYLSKVKNSEIYHSSINGDISGTIYPTIHEWLSFINDSDLVVTNSFHGVALSIILNKEFIALPSGGKTAGMNSRISSLLERCNLLDRTVSEFDKEKIDLLLKTKIKWDEVNSALESWKQEAFEFLEFDKHVQYNSSVIQ